MNEEYKERYLLALKQQQHSVHTKPYHQFMKMNGLKAVTKVSLSSMLNNTAGVLQIALDNTSLILHTLIYSERKQQAEKKMSRIATMKIKVEEVEVGQKFALHVPSVCDPTYKHYPLEMRCNDPKYGNVVVMSEYGNVIEMNRGALIYIPDPDGLYVEQAKNLTPQKAFYLDRDRSSPCVMIGYDHNHDDCRVVFRNCGDNSYHSMESSNHVFIDNV
jgi:hypothetical protein